jgi:hypothetical protein
LGRLIALSISVILIAFESQNQSRRDARLGTWRSTNALLRGQAAHEHISIEASAVATPVRMMVSPLEFFTRIKALPLFGRRRARASAWHQIARFIGQHENVSNDRRLALPNNFEREH